MSSTTRTDMGEPLRALILAHTSYGPTIYRPIGRSLVEQLRHVTDLLVVFAQTNCGSNCTAWVKPTAKSRWEKA